MTFILGFTDRVSLEQEGAHCSKDGFNNTKKDIERTLYMKQCINKLLLLIAASSMITGSHLHSMEQDASAVSTTTSVVSSTTTLLRV